MMLLKSLPKTAEPAFGQSAGAKSLRFSAPSKITFW